MSVIFGDETTNFEFIRFVKENLKTPADCDAFACLAILHCVGIKTPGQVLVQSMLRSYIPIRNTSVFTTEWFTPEQQEYLSPVIMEQMLKLLPPSSLHSLTLSNAGDVTAADVIAACKAIVYRTYTQYGGSTDGDQSEVVFDAHVHLLPFVHFFSNVFESVEQLGLHVSRESTATFFGTDATVHYPVSPDGYFYQITKHDREVVCGPPLIYHMALRILEVLDGTRSADGLLRLADMPSFTSIWANLPKETIVAGLDASKRLQPSAYAASIALLLEDKLVQSAVYVNPNDMIIRDKQMSVWVTADLKLKPTREVDRPSRLSVLRYLSLHGRA
jgi:hypothetical protein